MTITLNPIQFVAILAIIVVIALIGIIIIREIRSRFATLRAEQERISTIIRNLIEDDFTQRSRITKCEMVKNSLVNQMSRLEMTLRKLSHDAQDEVSQFDKLEEFVNGLHRIVNSHGISIAGLTKNATQQGEFEENVKKSFANVRKDMEHLKTETNDLQKKSAIIFSNTDTLAEWVGLLPVTKAKPKRKPK